MVFFTYFGIFAFVGVIIITILLNKELKKQLPTEQEKKELVEAGVISADCKDKKLLRSATQELRLMKEFAIKLGINDFKFADKNIIEVKDNN